MLIEISNQFSIDVGKLKNENPKLPFKVWELIFDILKSSNNPLEGIGKPEALKGEFSGYFSRRITDKHRIIYKFEKNFLLLLSCYGHYADK